MKLLFSVAWLLKCDVEFKELSLPSRRPNQQKAPPQKRAGLSEETKCGFAWLR
jgi:hypothetical protein